VEIDPEILARLLELGELKDRGERQRAGERMEVGAEGEVGGLGLPPGLTRALVEAIAHKTTIETPEQLEDLKAQLLDRNVNPAVADHIRALRWEWVLEARAARER
jgi:hypothetical protein